MLDRSELVKIQRETEHWESTTLKRTLDRFPERQAEFVTTSSAPVNRLYTPADVAGMVVITTLLTFAFLPLLLLFVLPGT